ncbi:tRNA (cytosine(38)-C(5))-methyltransferase [Smittium culicis]|uniref:tRNA (cytosine(38)-C(5))-methyltransferase n=1 Tax=Smittium culicis TaxID=133412 RepID=A0A1R1Y346_9FUNG|nr:tRNA (cytosine(38)-C(5))-methyltransferase [Smittium culicis]
MDKKPTYLFLENVYNFERSNTRKILVDALVEAGYLIEEFIVSPLQLGIPNDRLRYYLLAKMCTNNQTDLIKNYNLQPVDKLIKTQFPVQTFEFLKSTFKNLNINIQDGDISSDHSASNFLDSDAELSRYSDLSVPIEYVSRRNNYNFDVVNSKSKKCATFTKVSCEEILKKLENGDDSDIIEFVKTLKLRFFSPNELAQFMCFPVSSPNPENKYQPYPDPDLGQNIVLDFPQKVSIRQQHQLIGNSVNVAVISCLIHHLFSLHV